MKCEYVPRVNFELWWPSCAATHTTPSRADRCRSPPGRRATCALPGGARDTFSDVRADRFRTPAVPGIAQPDRSAPPRSLHRRRCRRDLVWPSLSPPEWSLGSRIPRPRTLTNLASGCRFSGLGYSTAFAMRARNSSNGRSRWLQATMASPEKRCEVYEGPCQDFRARYEAERLGARVQRFPEFAIALAGFSGIPNTLAHRQNDLARIDLFESRT